MTSSSTIVSAASDGTDMTTDVSRKPPLHGITRAREQQVYHVTGLAKSALYEAERLLDAVKNTALTRTLEDEGSESLDLAHVAHVVTEVLDCVDIAAEALSALNSAIRIRQDNALF